MEGTSLPRVKIILSVDVTVELCYNVHHGIVIIQYLFVIAVTSLYDENLRSKVLIWDRKREQFSFVKAVRSLKQCLETKNCKL